VLVGTQLPPVITTLSIATATLFAAMQIFYAFPMAYLPERAAASSVALINRFGLTGGDKARGLLRLPNSDDRLEWTLATALRLPMR
jgi:hypothetical protein